MYELNNHVTNAVNDAEARNEQVAALFNTEEGQRNPEMNNPDPNRPHSPPSPHFN
jgi:hypothetical protein